MESPNKRQRLSSDGPAPEADYVPLGLDDDNTDQAFGYGADNETNQAPPYAPTGSQAGNTKPARFRNARNDPRNAKDRPKSKHALPGHEPWILVRTKFGRRFAHNTKTNESFWYIPEHVMPGVREFERLEKEDKTAEQERDENARWAEQQLKEMREKSKAAQVNDAPYREEGRGRRRRSESLQREDEEAMMAELAAQAEHAEEHDAKEIAQAVEAQKPAGPQAGDYASDSEYEYVEVTDTEGEGDNHDGDEEPANVQAGAVEDVQEALEDGPVEFGEDDIAYQLAAMGEDYGLDPGEYGDEQMQEELEEGAEGLPFTEEDAVNLFRDMLDDHRISPYTPWDKVISDESEGSMLMDDRYTLLPSSKARKEAWDAWTKDKAAQLREERARMEKLDPRIPYLAFLAEKATPKLYWPEFKRKFKKESEMNDRKLVDKDREKLYRDHISRLKLPESTRKADLQNLLKSIPISALNNSTSLDALPQALLSNLHLISLPRSVRDPIIERHISALPPPPEAGEGALAEEQRAAETKQKAERQKREAALAEREKKVEEQHRQAEREEARAKRELTEGERELAQYARI